MLLRSRLVSPREMRSSPSSSGTAPAWPGVAAAAAAASRVVAGRPAGLALAAAAALPPARCSLARSLVVPPVRAHHDLSDPPAVTLAAARYSLLAAVRCFVSCRRARAPSLVRPLWAAPATRFCCLLSCPSPLAAHPARPACLAPLSPSRLFFGRRCEDVVGSRPGLAVLAVLAVLAGLSAGPRAVRRLRCCPLLFCCCLPSAAVCRLLLARSSTLFLFRPSAGLPLDTCILTSLPSAPSLPPSLFLLHGPRPLHAPSPRSCPRSPHFLLLAAGLPPVFVLLIQNSSIPLSPHLATLLELRD